MAKRTAAQQQMAAAHRKAQAKYVAKNPKAQDARVAAATAKRGKTSSKAGGKGDHGHTMGRPRKS